MKDNISPRPWEIGDGPEGVIPILAKDKPYLCVVRYSDNPNLSKAEGEANAAHIVKCVNAHEKLVEVLKDAKAWVELDPKAEVMEARIKSALKAAGEL